MLGAMVGDTVMFGSGVTVGFKAISSSSKSLPPPPYELFLINKSDVPVVAVKLNEYCVQKLLVMLPVVVLATILPKVSCRPNVKFGKITVAGLRLAV